MEYRILGPLEVLEDGHPVELGSKQQRSVLAVLVLRINELVSIDELVEVLWGSAAPPTAQKIVQNHVSKLRRALGDDSRPADDRILLTRSGGYTLRADSDSVDALVFTSLVEQAGAALDAGDATRASALAQQGLAMWRGRVLADLQYEAFAQPEAARLDELLLLAAERRSEAELNLGRHDALLGELEQLVLAHPQSERLCELQMLALYRSGRQIEALEVYKKARVQLDELGLEPGDELRRLQAAILRHDPELGRPARRPTPVSARAVRRWAYVGGAGAALLAIAVIAAASLLDGGSGSRPSLEPLSRSFCSPVRYQAGETPELLIVSDQELQGPAADIGNQIAAAIEFTLRRRAFDAGEHSVGYQACDGGEISGERDRAPCAIHGRAYADNPSVIGILGPAFSECTKDLLPVVNQAAGGPVPVVNSSNTQVGLTRSGPAAMPGEPEIYYPAGIRNYVRLMPADDYQAAALAQFAARLGLDRVFLLAFDDEGNSGVASGFSVAADRVGVEVVDRAEWKFVWGGYRDEAERVARSGAAGVVLLGGVYVNGDRLVRALRSRMGPDFPILASDGFAVPDLVELIGPAAEGMWVSNAGVSPEAAGPHRQFIRGLRDALGEEPSQFSLYAAAATELLLDAIAESDGTRESVIDALFDPSIRSGILGEYAITPEGDTTSNDVTIHRVKEGRLRPQRILQPSSNLIAGG